MPGSLTQAGGTSTTQSLATDAAGNVFVTGYFTGSVAFGATLLSSVGQTDLFVAKYVPSTATWAWAQSGGGTSYDAGSSIAVSGNSVYLTGYLYNSSNNATGVLLGGTGTTPGTVPQYGIVTGANSYELLVAKYTDNGTSATLGWTQVGGGTGVDYGNSIAVNGTSVYVAGTFQNTLANERSVLFGGTGTTPGTVQVNGASTVADNDLVLVKYTDNGSAASIAWTQVGGGTGSDEAYGVAVNGTNVYVSGQLTNTNINGNAVRLGGGGTTAGTVPVNGASATATADVLLAKYTDSGATVALGWTQVGGGTGSDQGYTVAVSGTSVYVAGTLTNTTTNDNGVLFGGGGTTAGTVPVNGASTAAATDVLLAKYTDNGTTGSYRWSQVGGGLGTDSGYALAVSGTSVYLAGGVANNAANANSVLFGGGGTTAGTVVLSGASATLSNDLLLAKYTDNGATATLSWAQAGGGIADDQATGVALSGSLVLAGAYVSSSPGYGFGAVGATALAGTSGPRVVLATANAGTGSWQALAAAYNGGTSYIRGVATDAGGNVFVTGYFTGQVDFGPTRLSSLGGQDLFVAKYQPGPGTWAWAQSGGGSANDQGQGIAVRGQAVYVTGSITNDQANTNGVLLGGTGTTPGTTPQYGATPTSSQDMLLARYTDAGSSATLAWTQVAGGTSTDTGQNVAVNGTSVYVVGSLNNNTTNDKGALLGGSGATAGTAVQYGATPTANTDLLLAKYTDNTTSAALTWSQVGGGTSNDSGYGLAVSGTSVYISGSIANDRANTQKVLFGGTGPTPGTAPQYGATSTSSLDLVLAKYTDAGATSSFVWSQVGGGTAVDTGYGVAVSSTNVYVAGGLANTATNTRGGLFGGAGTVAGTAQVNGATGTGNSDIILVKYTDGGPAGSYVWSQVGGGTDVDYAYSVAVVGSSVYVAGNLTNNAANSKGALFGGGGTTASTVQVNGASATASPDVLLAKYTDGGPTGSYVWSQVGGGNSFDYGYGLAVSGQNILLGASMTPSATFGSITLATPAGTSTNVLTRTVDNTLAPLPVQLVWFTATAAGPHAARLAWATASEQASAYFAIERSPDGTAWHELGQVVAAGNSATARTYGFTDTARPADAGVQYYRLRQVDQDGTIAYSPVRAVGGSEAATLSIYPNPSPGRATLVGAAAGASIRVLDATGRQVLTTTADAAGEASLSLPAGLYLVQTPGGTLRLSVQ